LISLKPRATIAIAFLLGTWVSKGFFPEGDH